MRAWLFGLALLWPLHAYADDALRVQAADPFLELRTGAGRGFPVYHVVDRDEWVVVLKRRTDWFKVRAENGKVGWVSRAQMERTLTEAGVQMTFRDLMIEDYLNRRIEVSFGGGAFESDPYMRVGIGYRVHDLFTIEMVYGQSSGDFSTSRVYYLALTSTPYPKARLAPVFSVGAGRFVNEPRATLVGAINTEADLLNVGLGLRGYLSERFALQADYRTHFALISDGRSDQYKELSAGVSFFF